MENGSDNRLYVYDGAAVLAEYAPDPALDPTKAASGPHSPAATRSPLEATGGRLEAARSRLGDARSLQTAAGGGPDAPTASLDSSQARSASPTLDPDGFFKARQYLYGTTLLAAESFDPSLEPPAPILVCYHLDALGSTVNLTAGEDIPGGPAAGTVTAAYLYDAWGNYRELDITDPALPGEPVWTANPDLDENGLYVWEDYLASIQGSFWPSLEPLASSLVWNRLTYTGHEFDPETGLYYFKARFYDPELGRFASEDPYLGDTLTPPSLHRYLYANVSPLRFIDLFGYQGEETLEQLRERLAQQALKSHERDVRRYGGFADHPELTGSEVIDRGAEAAKQTGKALTSGRNYSEGVAQAHDVFAKLAHDPGAIIGGMFGLPELISEGVKANLSEAAQLYANWDSLSSEDRQRRIREMADRIVVAGVREGVILITVKSGGRVCEYTLFKVDEAQWSTRVRMQVGKYEICAETDTRIVVRNSTERAAAVGETRIGPSAGTGRALPSGGEASGLRTSPVIEMQKRIETGAHGELKVIYEIPKKSAKRGPKPKGEGSHNLTIERRIEEIKTELGPDWDHISGGSMKEEYVPTPGGLKSSRRPDITFRNKKTGELYRENVGKKKFSGEPVKREAGAIEDLEKVGPKPNFTPYN